MRKSASLSTYNETLPSCSSVVLEVDQKIERSIDLDTSAELVDRIKESVSRDKPVNILAIDDEKLYLRVLENHLNSSEELKDIVKIHKLSSGEKALEALGENTFEQQLLILIWEK